MKIYLDTNAFYFFFFHDVDYSEGIKKIIASIISEENEGITSTLTLDELAYVLLMRMIEKKYKIHPVAMLRKDRNVIIEFAGVIEDIFTTILSIDNLKIIPAEKDACSIVPIYMRKHALLPRDCIHLIAMQQNGCSHILSTDRDFDGIPGITRIGPPVQ